MDRLDNIMKDLRAQAAQDAKPELPSSPPRPRRTPPRTPPRTPSDAPATGRRLSLPQAKGQRIAAVIALVVLAVLFLTVIADAVGSRSSASVAPVKHVKVRVTDPAPGFMQAATPLDWKPVIEQLDVRRARVFTDLEASRLLEVDAVPSPALATDEALVAALRKSHAHLASYPMRIISVREQYLTVGEKQPRAMLTVVDELGAYDIVDAEGKVLRTMPARGRATWKVELVNRPGWGWVYVSAVRAAKQ